MKSFRNRFRALADGFQSSIEAAIETHLGSVRSTLDIVRNENAVLESEQDPEFRGRVEASIRTANDEIRRLWPRPGSENIV